MTQPGFTNNLTPKQLTPRRTPIQNRSYLHSHHGFHQQLSPHNFSATGSVHAMQQTRSIPSEDSQEIYGTNISRRKIEGILQKFINEFQIQQEEGISQKIYLTQLSELDILQNYIFIVEAIHLKQFDLEIYYQFIYFPAEMLICFDNVIKNLYEKMHITEQLSSDLISQKMVKKDRLIVQIRNLHESKAMKNLSVWEINKLISFRGIIVRVSEINPQMKRADFKCVKCGDQTKIQLQNAKVEQPKSCPRCLGKNTYEVMHNFCQFTDKQFIKIQQLPQQVPEGQTPNSMTVIAYDYNVDAARPGDRVEVVGIYRAQQIKVQKRQKTLKSVFKTHLDLISCRIADQNRFKGAYGNEVVEFNDSDKQQFFNMAQRPKIIQELIESFAPSIHGNHHIKKGILAQLFGGTKKQILEEGRGRFRADINICLVGDPSTAKSQLLQQIHKIAPRGIYTSGRGSTTVGLTAYVKKDPETSQFVLESGALVLSDLGICCIDQFDKMNDDNKIILLEGMEQQTISIAKAGIVCQLNCRTAIISAANPIHSRYNPKKSVIQNISLPPALLSRFDLIYIMLDQPNQKNDIEMAQHILNIFATNDAQQSNQLLERKAKFYNRQILTKYITYARQYLSPQISQKAGERLIQAYSQMRKMGNRFKTITSTPRQLQSLIRLSEAFAKMRLSSVVTQSDVFQAVDLITIATQQAATDPTTGQIDMDVIVTGKTSALRQKIHNISQKIKQIVKANVSKYRKKTSFQNIFVQTENRLKNIETIKQKQVIEALKRLESQGLLVTFTSEKNKLYFKLAKDLD